jgi:putative Holliday junction resolvase
MKTYLCIDLGEKRIGLATGSLETRLARRLGVINHQSRNLDIEKILAVAGENQVTNIVIGISYQEDGAPNSMGRHALSFGTALQAACGIPVEYCDEALSTVDAREKALVSGFSRKARGGHQDALAAEIILQSFFDQIPPNDL